MRTQQVESNFINIRESERESFFPILSLEHFHLSRENAFPFDFKFSFITLARSSRHLSCRRFEDPEWSKSFVDSDIKVYIVSICKSWKNNKVEHKVFAEKYCEKVL